MMISKSDYKKLKEMVNDNTKTGLSDLQLKRMLKSYFCDDATKKEPLSRMNLAQWWVDRFRKSMKKLGYKETISLLGGCGNSGPVKFSAENAYLYATQQNMIIPAKEFAR